MGIPLNIRKATTVYSINKRNIIERKKMSETVSFKVYLTDLTEEGDPEVRRFVVDREVSTSFTYFQQKLIAVYPRLRNKVFAVNWTDMDGDNVTIATDEELIIALTEMTGPLYKMQVVIKGGKKE